MSPVKARPCARSFYQRHISVGIFVALLGVLDLTVVAVTGAVANWVHFDTLSIAGPRGFVIVLAVLIASFAFRYTKLHDRAALANPIAQIRRTITAMLIAAFVVFAVCYATNTLETVSRLWLGIWLLAAFLTLALSRPAVAGLYVMLEKAGAFSKRFAVFSTVSELDWLQEFLDRWNTNMSPSDTIEGVFLDYPELASERGFQSVNLVKGSVDDFLAWNKSHRVDSAIAVMSAANSRQVEPVLQKLRAISLNVDLVASRTDQEWAQCEIGKLAGLPATRIMTQPLNGGQFVLKRTMDVMIAGIALLLFAPLMLAIVIAIKISSPGPVIFRQDRHGFNNSIFQVLKFRTMHHTKEVRLDLTQARRNDPRVTRLGALLRKTSMDELPQLFNVLRGDMSIVGPRPHAVEHNNMFAEHIDGYSARHRALPGITGWAQVHGLRGETRTLEEMRQRVEYDLFYVEHWSLALDFKIMIMTFGCLVDSNAY